MNRSKAILWLIFILIILAILVPADIVVWNLKVGGVPLFEIVGVVLTISLMVAAGGKALEIAGGAAVKVGGGIMEMREKSRALRTPQVLAQHQNFVMTADPKGRTSTYDGVQAGVVVQAETTRAVAQYQQHTLATNQRVEWEARTAISRIEQEAGIVIARYKFEIEQLHLQRQREADLARIRIQETRMQSQLLLAAMAARALPAPTAEETQQGGDQVPPSAIDLLDVLGFWRPAPDELLLGVVIRNGQYFPLVVHPKKAEHIGILGSTGNGKTNILRLTLAQLSLWPSNKCYFISPHYADVKANGDDWTSIRKRLQAMPCRSGEEIESLLVWAVEELEDRCRREAVKDFSWRENDIYIAVDELPEVVKRYPGAPEKLDTLLRRGRAYGIYIINASQDFLVKTTGSGSAVREQYHTILYVGGDEHSARKMLNVTGAIEREGELGHEGLIYLRSRATPRAVYCRYPYASNAGIELLGGFAASGNTVESETGTSVEDARVGGLSNITELFPLPPKPKTGPQTVVTAEERQEIINYFLNEGLNRTQIASTMGYNGEEYKLVKQVLDQFINQTIITLYLEGAAVEQMLSALHYPATNVRARNMVERVLFVVVRHEKGFSIQQIMAALRAQPDDEKARDYVTGIVEEYEAVSASRRDAEQAGEDAVLVDEDEDEERAVGER